MSSKGYFVQDEQGRRLSISRDVYNYIQRIQKKNQADQEGMCNDLKKVNEALSTKPYEAENENMYLAVKFDEKGQIKTDYDEVAQALDMTLELKGDLAKLPGPVQEKCQNVILNFIGCVNQALSQKTEETETKLKSLHKEILNSEKSGNVA